LCIITIIIIGIQIQGVSPQQVIRFIQQKSA